MILSVIKGFLPRSAGLALLAFFPALVAGQGTPAPLITVTGASEELGANILASLEVGIEACDSSLLRLRRLIPGLTASAREAAQALGFYESRITPVFRAGETCWELDLAVEPGQQVLLRNVDIVINADPRDAVLFESLLEETGLVSGQPLHHGRYEALKSRLSTEASDNGYFEARFNQARIEVHTAEHVADISLEFVPGPRFRFGVINVNKSPALSDELIGTLMTVQEGDFYSTQGLADLRRDFDRSEYFRQIRISPQLRQASGQSVPVNVDLDLRPRHAWTSGVGFTTDTGPRARVEYENRFLNTRGHRLLTDASISSVRNQVNGSYIIPLGIELAQSLGLNLGLISEDNDAFESKRLQAGISLPKDADNGWRRTLSLDFQRDNYVINEEEEVSVLTLPGISFTKTLADDLINPNNGWKVFTSLKGSSNSFLSDTSFLQLYASAKYVKGFGRSRLLARLDMGATLIDLANELPASLRFYAGGDRSVRGYDFNSLGPLDPGTEELVGGKNLVVGSLEYDFLVRQNWRFAMFADSGNAYDDRNDFDLKHSLGFGIRWLSPIGPLRVDLAHPFDSDESFRLHITMGPDL